MKKLDRKISAATAATFLLFFSCSAPSSDKEKNGVIDSAFFETNTGNANIEADTVNCPGQGFLKFIDEAAKLGFALHQPIGTSNQRDLFALANVQETLSYLETGILSRTKNAVLVLYHDGVSYGVEEWAFNSLSEAELVEHALTAPLGDKKKERFIRTPFTFWRITNRIYYLHVENEKLRAEMEKINNLLVNCLTPSSADQKP